MRVDAALFTVNQMFGQLVYCLKNLCRRASALLLRGQIEITVLILTDRKHEIVCAILISESEKGGSVSF